MKNTDKIKMQVSIAGVPVSLNVPFDEQDAVRETEQGIADLYNNWRIRFPNKSLETLLAMIAYHYHSIMASNAALSQTIRDSIDVIDSTLEQKAD